MRDLYLVDYTHDKTKTRKDRLYKVVAEIAIRHGSAGNGFEKYDEDLIRRFWDYDDPFPSVEFMKKNIRVSGLKWFIRNEVKYDDGIWNADFLHGLTKCGRVRWSKTHYPSLSWNGNDIVKKMVLASPFGGKFWENKNKYRRWSGVPALYLSYSEDSISFMAGVLSNGKVVKIGDKTYTRYSKWAVPYLKQWKIPIEIENKKLKKYYTSPFWAALFSIKMPEEVRDEWFNLKNPCNAFEYSAILWKVYMNNNFPTAKIPYLPSRRKIYYEYKSEEGAMKKLEKMRVKKEMTELDYRVRDVVKIWGSS